MFDSNTNKAKRTELENYLKCIYRNHNAFMALTDFGAIDGATVDESCVPIDKGIIQQIMRDFVMLNLGRPKINGKVNNWSCGDMGSRWMDMDASKYGLAYIRCALYSKKFAQGEWRTDKPFVIRITCEKTE